MLLRFGGCVQHNKGKRMCVVFQAPLSGLLVMAMDLRYTQRVHHLFIICEHSHTDF